MMPLAVLFCIMFSGSLAYGKSLVTKAADISEVKGTFALILYGDRYSDDIETVAFLDIEGDGLTFEPYAPAFDYRVEKGLSARQAAERAEKFVRGARGFWRSILSKILDEKGVVVGYELRPLYFPLAFGVSDVLDIDYRISGDKVDIYIRLIPLAERHRSGGKRFLDMGH